MYQANAHLLCAICSHKWKKSLHFRTLELVHAHDFNKEQCPECEAQASVLISHDEKPNAAAGFDENEIDNDDPADNWKKS